MGGWHKSTSGSPSVSGVSVLSVYRCIKGRMRSTSIDVLITLSALQDSLANNAIIVIIDNLTVVVYLNKQGSTASLPCCILAQHILMSLELHLLDQRTRYIHGRKNMVKSLKVLQVTNEQQGNGTSILHQVAQHPIDQVYLYTRRPCPSLPTQDLEEQGTRCRAGRPMHPSKPPHPLLRGAVEKYGQWNFYQRLWCPRDAQGDWNGNTDDGRHFSS